MFSTSSNAVSQLILAEGNYNEFLDVTQFGDDEHIEQMIQILNSREIKDHMIAKFNLIDHYDIDTTKKYWKTKLYKFVKNNIQFSRTDNLAVEITVEDTDPVLAANMANEIADYYDILKREIVQQRSKEAFAILEEEMKLTDQLIMELTDSLSRIMSKGVYDYETQSERLMQQYAIELAKGNMAAVKRIKDELLILEQYAPLYVSVRDRLFYLKEAQKLFQEKYQNTRVDASYTLPQKFVVEKAVPADKKSYPKKMLITIVSTFCVLLFTLFLLIFKETITSGLHTIGQQLRHKA
jgi:uncharacterized protein involved in exopolysaccharide biosynthesis